MYLKYLKLKYSLCKTALFFYVSEIQFHSFYHHIFDMYLYNMKSNYSCEISEM